MSLGSESAVVAIHCATCQRKARAHSHSVDVPGMGRAVWLRMPPGWTALLPIVDVNSLHCRCPEHGFKARRS